MEALHYAYDKDAINQRVLGGTATPSCNFTSPLAWFYQDIPCYKTDMAKAAQILADAGFTKGSRRRPRGEERHPGRPRRPAPAPTASTASTP